MLKYMDYAYAVYKERSFTKAAEKLYISQPALSLTIKKLENELGYPVFERCGKEIGLTPVGEKYIRAIEAIMDIQQGLQKGIEDLVELRSGHVSLACATVISSYVLPNLIKEFRQHYPNVDFEVTVCEAADQERRVENGTVDIAIDGAVGRLAGMEYVPYFDEQLVLAVPADREVNRRLRDRQIPLETILDRTCDYDSLPRVDLSEFRDEFFITMREFNPLSQYIGGMFRRRDILPKVSMQFDHIITSLNYAECGFGCCFTTDISLRYKERARDLVLYLPDDPHSARPVYMIYKKNKYLSSAAQEFIEFAKKHPI